MLRLAQSFVITKLRRLILKFLRSYYISRLNCYVRMKLSTKTGYNCYYVIHYQILQKLISQHKFAYTEAAADHNREKNRFHDKIPSKFDHKFFEQRIMSLLFSSTADDVWRVRLKHGSQKGSNYINASFVHVSCCKIRSVSIILILISCTFKSNTLFCTSNIQ